MATWRVRKSHIYIKWFVKFKLDIDYCVNIHDSIKSDWRGFILLV